MSFFSQREREEHAGVEKTSVLWRNSSRHAIFLQEKKIKPMESHPSGKDTNSLSNVLTTCQLLTAKKKKKAKGITLEWKGHQFFGQRPHGVSGDAAADNWVSVHYWPAPACRHHWPAVRTTSLGSSSDLHQFSLVSECCIHCDSGWQPVSVILLSSHDDSVLNPRAARQFF